MKQVILRRIKEKTIRERYEDPSSNMDASMKSLYNLKKNVVTYLPKALHHGSYKEIKNYTFD
jgi:hypothetical protein